MKINKLTQNQTNNQNTDIQFYPRVINKTNIFFSDDELTLLNKGLKYNLSQKRKHWLSDLAFEAEAAVTLLPPCEQEHIRYQIALNLQKLYRQHNGKHTVINKTVMHENKTINQIKKDILDKPWTCS
jgi:hypothetical protein